LANTGYEMDKRIFECELPSKFYK